ncbi:MAG: 3-oxoacyl-[acyl-carrier-protein] reductase FabG [Phycisphaerae bacterium]|nr:3-oxoacyl-[acyl-carrier-protein] reductase FabG [Phycisphaerae bacterium]
MDQTSPASNASVALVTGAAKRIGRAVALELARAGFNVVIHYHHSLDEAHATAAAIQQSGHSAWLVSADLNDATAAGQILQFVQQQAGRLDVLVNNAAEFTPMSLDNFDAARWQQTQQINLVTPLALCQAAAPLLRQQRGVIINFLDIAIDRPWKNYLAYGASKAGLEYLTRALARALAPEIRVNGVAPGITVFPDDYSDEQRRQLTSPVPLQRPGTPEEMAHAVRFLVEAPYITGQIIRVDGGRLLV